MGRYTGPTERLSRSVGIDLNLKGKRAEAGKTSFKKGRTRPGQHGQNRQKLSEYGIRLKEKQKLKFMYGLYERQLRKYYVKASNSKGVTGEVLVQLLERRLDNVVYRMKFATTRAQARQLVSHGHILVDGKKVDIPSYQVKPGQVISVKEKSRDFVKRELEGFYGSPIPNWISVNEDALTGQVLSLPVRDEIDTFNSIKENFVVEFYSK
ncbi:MAG: 30S ribosomal protein S4 [Candidatus Sericytochromatia bacterium]|nr:MAG: 30S ribosomal protein S4 [Candidatus Sericytochromatia bacterium]